MTLKSSQTVTFKLYKVDQNYQDGTSLAGVAPDCSIDDPAIRANLLSNKTINLASLYQTCAERFPGFDKNATYRLDLVAHNGSNSTNLTGYMIATHYTYFTRMAGGGPVISTSPSASTSGWYQQEYLTGMGAPLEVLYEDMAESMRNGNMNFTGEGSVCDWYGDPLIVRLADSVGPTSGINMTSVLDGIIYDLLGSSMEDMPHQKIHTAWIAPNPRSRDFFVVLPDEYGRIVGIDQLFGNNTRGPDGKLAADGFAALRKFDGLAQDGSYVARMRDGVINAKDPVFSRLRLWSDRNGDGIAQPAEVFTLRELGVMEFDLNYDASYQETDRYGNQVKYKSVVKTADGAFHLMYDLWFKIGGF